MNTHIPMTNKGRAAVYGRASTDNQDVGLTTAAQGDQGRRYGQMLGYIVEDEDLYLEEDGVSGMKGAGPKLRALMLKVFSPERPYEAVIVIGLDRLSRSSGNYIEYEQIFAEGDIEILSPLDPPKNTQTKIDTPRRMKAIMNEEQVIASTLKTRNSQMFVVQMGFYIGWVQPFGYRKKKVMWMKAEHTKLEPDPETWPHLLHIIDMAKTNHTLDQIRAYLESTGLEHPAAKIENKKEGKHGNRGNGKWTKDNVSYLLKNLALLGWTFRGGENSGSDILYKTAQVTCPDAHQAAMTEEDRELIIRNLAGRRGEVKSPRTHKSPNPMSELVVCGMCGAIMRMHTEDGTQRLICANKREHRKEHPNWCPNVSARLDMLVERTTEAITGHILTPEVLNRQVKLVANENREFVAHQEDRKKQIEKRIQKLDKEIGNFMDAIAEYGPTNPAFGREIEHRQNNKEHLQREKEAINSELEEKLLFLNEPERIVENALNLRTYLDTEDHHSLKEMLNHLIRKVSIVNNVATVYYTVPLPRHGTKEPILKEKLRLGKKTCPSVVHAGAGSWSPAFYKRSDADRTTLQSSCRVRFWPLTTRPCGVPTTAIQARRPSTWSVPGPRRTPWCWVRPRWRASPMKSPPYPSCSRCWMCRNASSPSMPWAARGT